MMLRYFLLVFPALCCNDVFGAGEPGSKYSGDDAILNQTASLDLRISGGRRLSHRKYPWLVTQGWVRGGSWIPNCGASIITPSHILTAAHCFYDPPKVPSIPPIQQTGVLVGAFHIYSPNMNNVRRVQNLFLHENYRQYVNDIAILVLLEPLRYRDGVQPICLPSPNVDVTHQRVQIAGNGAEMAQSAMTNQPKEMTTDVVRTDVCVQHYGNHHPMLPQGQICTWTQGQSSCNGDSGGPVMWLNPRNNKYVLVGLVSFGSRSCGNQPTVHTRVAAYTQWIQSKLSGHQFCYGA